MYKFKVLLVVVALTFNGTAFAEDARVKDIREHLSKFENEEVTVTGFIAHFQDSDARSTNFYTIKDDWNAKIPVRTSAGLPEVGKRYKVKGIVTYKNENNKLFVYLSETGRSEIEKAIVAKERLIQELLAKGRQAVNVGDFKEAIGYLEHARSIDPANQEANQLLSTAKQGLDKQKNMWMMIGIAGVVFVVLIIILIVILLRRRQEGGEIYTETAIPGSSVDEGKTVKMMVPPSGTMELLPGKFVVLKGEDDKKEIRLKLPKGSATKEFTIGRKSIPESNPYSHIQLKVDTVSRDQAKLVCTNGKYTITNISTVNKTLVNGKALGENESTELKDGDVIVMGEVEFKYESK